MSRIVFLLAFFLLLLTAVRPQAKVQRMKTISEVLAQISLAEWIKDSLAGRGYRVSFFKDLSTASLDETSPNKVMSVLGKAGDTLITHNEIEYRFYLLDSEIYKRNKIFEMPYLAFVFSRVSNRITGIRKDYLCY